MITRSRIEEIKRISSSRIENGIYVSVPISPSDAIGLCALALKALEQEKLVVALNTCKNDYWFMINLLERYSTDKDQAIKDCIERMKFRKPMFDAATADTEKG
jgi:hypothetical protein